MSERVVGEPWCVALGIVIDEYCLRVYRSIMGVSGFFCMSSSEEAVLRSVWKGSCAGSFVCSEEGGVIASRMCCEGVLVFIGGRYYVSFHYVFFEMFGPTGEVRMP